MPHILIAGTIATNRNRFHIPKTGKPRATVEIDVDGRKYFVVAYDFKMAEIKALYAERRRLDPRQSYRRNWSRRHDYRRACRGEANDGAPPAVDKPVAGSNGAAVHVVIYRKTGRRERARHLSGPGPLNVPPIVVVLDNSHAPKKRPMFDVMQKSVHRRFEAI